MYDVCGDGEHPSKCNARRMRTMRVNLRRTHTGADPTSPYAKRQARHEHAARDAIRLITQFVPYRRNATDLGLLRYAPNPLTTTGPGRYTHQASATASTSLCVVLPLIPIII